MNATPKKDRMAQSAQPVAPEKTAPAAPEPKRPRGRRTALMLALPVLLLLGAGAYWLMGGRYETTDNANMHVARISIASDIPGRVVTVAIEDNQTVKAGDILFQVDPEPSRLAVDQAKAGVAAARLAVEEQKVAYAQAQTAARAAAEELAYQQSELDRQTVLSHKGVASTTALTDAQHAVRKADEAKQAADQAVTQALTALGGAVDIPADEHPSVLAALSQLDQASYQLSQTTVHAPSDGVIYQAASFRPGQFVAAGQQLFALIETSDQWVDANFKETQLGDIRVGQSAEVTFDMMPNQPVKAHVAAIGAGTGAEFSLLPAQNATGNWVKVTQRVPVRLELDEAPDLSGIGSGVSASVSVDTGKSRSLGDIFSAFAG